MFKKLDLATDGDKACIYLVFNVVPDKVTPLGVRALTCGPVSSAAPITSADQGGPQSVDHKLLHFIKVHGRQELMCLKTLRGTYLAQLPLAFSCGKHPLPSNREAISYATLLGDVPACCVYAEGVMVLDRPSPLCNVRVFYD